MFSSADKCLGIWTSHLFATTMASASQSGYAPRDKKHDLISFGEWKAIHARVYESPDEEVRRREIWDQTRLEVKSHNDKYDRNEGPSFPRGMNQFADLTMEEFQKKYKGVRTLEDREREL